MKRFLTTCCGALLSCCFAPGCGGAGSEGPPNIVLITLESLRPDHVGAYGCERPTTPNLDRFTSESIRFTDAHSVTSWTLPAHASILTGLYPPEHRVLEPTDRLGKGFRTVAEILRGGVPAAPKGYETAAFVSGPFLRRTHGLDRGFESYDDSAASPGELESHGDVTNGAMERKIVSFLESSHERPFFLFAYFWDIHYDYIPPPPYDTMFVGKDAEPFDITRYEFNDRIRNGMSESRLKYVISQYDGEIRCTDDLLGRLFDEMRKRNLWENTVIIITADHGEEFFDHGDKGHKKNLFVESVHVPLWIKMAHGQGGGTVDNTLVSLVDIAPTIVEGILGSEGTAWEGESILPARQDRACREIYFDLALPLVAMVDGRIVARRVDRWRAVRNKDFKYIELPNGEGERLFSVADDRSESEDLAGRLSAVRDTLAEHLAAWLDRTKSAGAANARERAKLTDEERKRLEALGYIK